MIQLLRDVARALRRAPFSNGVNLIALALGFACFLGAWIVGSYWSLSDNHFENAGRIQVITQKFTGGNRATTTWAYSARPTAKYLRLDFPELEAVGRLREGIPYNAVGADWKTTLYGADADAEFLRVFDFRFIHGDPDTALAAENSIVLTRRVAEQYFPGQNPIGEIIVLRSDFPHTVTGVIEDIPSPSFFGNNPGARHRFDFLRSWPPERPDAREWWLHNTNMTYVLTAEEMTPGAQQAFRDRLANLAERYVPEDQWAQANVQLDAIGLDDLTTLYIDSGLFRGSSDTLSIKRILYGIGGLILLIACVNYTNLSVALSTMRAREVGMRKVLGASRSSILLGLWGEALLLASLAAIVAWIIVFTAAPLFMRHLNIDPHFVIDARPAIIGVFLGLVLAVSLAVSVYPTLYLMRIRPVEALRMGRLKSGPKRLTQGLIGVQFFFASVLLIVILVMQQQHDFMRDRMTASSADPIAVLTDFSSRRIGIDQLEADLANEPSIKALSGIYFPPWSRCCLIRAYTRAGATDAARTDGLVSRVGVNFFNVFDVDLLAGRVFDPTRDQPAVPSNQIGEGVPPYMPVIIDRLMATSLGFTSPREAVGEDIYLFDPLTGMAVAEEPPRHVIGVVETVALNISAGDVRANIYEIGGSVPIARLEPDQIVDGVEALIAAVEARTPSAVVDVQFVDAMFDRSFRTQRGIFRTLTGLSIVALVIAAIGLLGMATFVANRRRHEIGVRKTLGARPGQIMTLLLADFIKPVLAASLLASPAAYFAATAYLQSFMERAPLSPIPWVFGILTILLMSCGVVAAQAYRAAQTRPLEVLRND